MSEGKIPRDALLLYHRQGDLLRYKTEGMTNYELRAICVGIWARLAADDRADMIAELTSYQTDPDGFLPATSAVIARALANKDSQVPLRDVARLLTKDLPE